MTTRQKTLSGPLLRDQASGAGKSFKKAKKNVAPIMNKFLQKI